MNTIIYFIIILRIVSKFCIICLGLFPKKQSYIIIWIRVNNKYHTTVTLELLFTMGFKDQTIYNTKHTSRRQCIPHITLANSHHTSLSHIKNHILQLKYSSNTRNITYYTLLLKLHLISHILHLAFKKINYYPKSGIYQPTLE